jgi:hypothetical protein
MAAHLMIHLTEAGTPGVGLPAAPGYAGERHTGLSLTHSLVQRCRAAAAHRPGPQLQSHRFCVVTAFRCDHAGRWQQC